MYMEHSLFRGGAIDSNYTSSLLAAVLLCVESQINEIRSLWMVPYPHQTALIVKFIF
jgi:hypothetical protein